MVMMSSINNCSKNYILGVLLPGLCLTATSLSASLIEFLKENQMDFENSMALNMGQWLSIPFVIIGIYFMFFYGKKKSVK